MGNVIEFGNKSERLLDRFVAAYQRIMRENEPVAIFEINEEKMSDLDDAATLIRKVTENENVSVFAGYDDDNKTVGYISVVGDYLWVPNDEMLDYLQAAEILSDGVEFGATVDGKFTYTLTFHDIMEVKRYLN